MAASPICIGIVGVNWAQSYTSYEGRKSWPTDGKKYPHPLQEAKDVERDLFARVTQNFDELILLRFRATNKRPFAFSWVSRTDTENLYGAALLRISIKYELQF